MKKIVDKYALLEVIGAGQYGKVFRAETTDTNELYAVKVIPIEKFRKIQKLNEFTVNEIKVLSEINHPNIMKYYDKLMTSNNVYMIYEYCNGGTLEDLIYKNRHLNEIESIKYLGSLIDAFRLLNEKNTMHRDLKPSNILIHNGELKMGDFGFCKPLNYRNEMSKTMVGSPIYMAPEILKGQCYNIKADIWSLGVVYYEMWFGKCPFEEKTIPKLINLLETKSLTVDKHINNISKESENILRKILVTNPYQRINFNELINLYNTTLRTKLINKNNVISYKNIENSYISNNKMKNEDFSQNTTLNQTNKSKSPLKKIFDDNKRKVKKISTSPIRKNDVSISPLKDKKEYSKYNFNKPVYKNENLNKIKENNNDNNNNRNLIKDIPWYLNNFIKKFQNNDNIKKLHNIFNKFKNKPKLINSVFEIFEDRIKANLLTNLCEFITNYYTFEKDNFYILYLMIMKKVRNYYLEIKIKLTSIDNKVNKDILEDIMNFKELLKKENEIFNNLFLQVIDMIEKYVKENDVDYTLKLILQKPFEFDWYYYKNSIKDIINKIDNNNNKHKKELLYLKTLLLDLLLIDEYLVYFFKLNTNKLDKTYFDIINKWNDEELIVFNIEKYNFIKLNYLI